MYTEKDLVEIITQVKKDYFELEDNANEEQVQNHLIVPLLKKLGYKHHNWFHYQSRKMKGKLIFDIDIYPPDAPTKRIVVEVKKKGLQITTKEILQASTYVNSQARVNYIIICNGEDYYLLDNSIQGELEQRVMLKLNIFEEKDLAFFKFLSYESIFENGITKYLTDLAQYKVFFLEENKQSSWETYYGTLSNFFLFMANSEVYYPLDRIRVEDFQAFLNNKGINEKSIVTQVNNYNHINGLYEAYKVRGLLKTNPFEYIVNKLKAKVKKEINEPLQDFEIEMIINSLKETHYPERNILLFHMLLYTGMSRGCIQNLRIDNIDLEHKKILINGKKYLTINEVLRQNFEQYFGWINRKEIKTDYLFPSNYGKCKGNNLASGSFNSILNSCLKRTEISVERQKIITLKFIRESVVRRMYMAGISIEEIVYVTGLTLSSVGKYISNKKMIERARPENIIKNNPFKDLIWN